MDCSLSLRALKIYQVRSPANNKTFIILNDQASDNRTRFYVLAPMHSALPKSIKPADSPRALLSLIGNIQSANLESIFHRSQLQPIRVDSRPSVPKSFAEDIYIIEVQPTADDMLAWEDRILTLIKNITALAWLVKLLGVW